MSARFKTPLQPGRFPGFPRPFDLVSEDRALVGNVLRPWPKSTARLSAAQTSAISEHILLLTSVPAQQRVLVFTQAPDHIRRWLAVYGHLTGDIEFYHHRSPGELEHLRRA